MKNKKLYDFIAKCEREITGFVVDELRRPAEYDYADRQTIRSLNKILYKLK